MDSPQVAMDSPQVAMDDPQVAIASLLIAWILAAVSVGRISIRYKLAFKNKDVIQSAVALSNFTFAPGMLDILSSAVPPTLEYIKSLPNITSKDVPRNIWGVYLHVLEKAGHPPILYVGSGTDYANGLRRRIRSYELDRQLPKYVEIALRDGYVISHSVILVQCTIPTAYDDAEVRNGVLGAEAWCHCVFWTMRRKDHDYGFNHLCPWSLDSFVWAGANSHNPLKVKGAKVRTATPDEIAAARAAVQARAKVYRTGWKRQQYASWTEEERVANRKYQKKTRDSRTPARHQEVLADARMRKTKWESTNKALKKYYCEVCDKACRAPSDLEQHLNTEKHKDMVAKANGAVQAPIPQWRTNLREKAREAIANKTFYCGVCDKPFENKANLAAHLTRPKHLKNLARREAGETDAVQTDAMETDAAQTDAVQTDAVQTDAVQTDAMETDAVQIDAMQTGAIQVTGAV